MDEIERIFRLTAWATASVAAIAAIIKNLSDLKNKKKKATDSHQEVNVASRNKEEKELIDNFLLIPIYHVHLKL